MKKLYEWFLKSGQVEKANEILKIPRYAHFAGKPEEKKVVTSGRRR